MNQQRLGFHNFILPAWQAMDEESREDIWLDSLSEAKIFDCRQLPVGFVQNTGEAVFEDYRQLQQMVRLPFNACYFEFSDGFGIYAQEGAMAWDAPGQPLEGIASAPADDPRFHHQVEVHPFTEWDTLSRDLPDYAHVIGEFPNGYAGPDGSDDPFFHTNSISGHTDIRDPEVRHYDAANEAGRRLLAILSMLDEKLLASEFVPDPAPQLTRSRRRMGRPPRTGDSYVITVNVAAVRRIAKRPVGTHESPCLHWRRGHPRTLHRGSEFERRTWVPRCLVGDPARGYISKDYRLIRHEPLIKESAA